MVTTNITKDDIVSLEAVINFLQTYTLASARGYKKGVDIRKKPDPETALIGEKEQWFLDRGFTRYVPNAKDNAEMLANKAVELAEFTQGSDPDRQASNLKIAQFMGIERIVLNALTNAYRAKVTPTPYQHFVELHERGLRDEKSRLYYINTLKAAQNDMIISILQTMHPTIYHTKFARKKETELTGYLERIADDIKQPTQGERSVNTELLTKAEEAIDNLIAGVSGGENITHASRITVAEENLLDHENYLAMKANFEFVIGEYNRALEDVANTFSHELIPGKDPPETVLSVQEAEEIKNLAIDLKKRNPFEWRTWALGADADGRPKSTSPVLWQYIYYRVDPETNEYISRKRDTRENAEQHKETVSALIQRSFLLDEGREAEKEVEAIPKGKYGGEFIKICNEFIEESNARNATRQHTNGDQERSKTWESPYKSILQELSLEEQAKFLRRFVAGEYDDRLGKDFHFLPPVIKEEAIAFNQMFFEKYPEFIKANKSRLKDELHIELQPVTNDDGTPLQKDGETVYLMPEMESLLLENGEPSQLLIDICKFIEEQEVHLEKGRTGEGEDIHFTIDPKNLNYERAELAERVEHSRLFEDAHTLNSKGRKEKVTLAHRRKLLDVLKRAYILDHAIEDLGNGVSDRYQISEFGTAADFYATMLLFKEAGIIKVVNGEVVREVDGNGTVTSPKLSIQPLLEKAEDQANAPVMFEKLLEDPLVRSYYKALGRVEVMFGCSDGAKSAGNFSSEWSNYQDTRRLQQVFIEACEKYPDLKDVNLRLRVLYGRGHGDSRGGHLAEGQSQHMMAPELEQDMIYDVTLQSDLPAQMLISPAFGRDTCASILAGTVTAKFEAEQELKKRQEDPDYRVWMIKIEELIDGIAEASKEGYRDLVSKKPETTIFMDTVNDNTLRSSREPKRTDGEKKKGVENLEAFSEQMAVSADDAAEKLDGTRAITVEYAFQAMAHFPVHYLGMREALQQFIDDGNKRIEENGKQQTGVEALKVLYRNHPYFRSMMDKTRIALRNYDRDVFRQYAKIAGVPDWAEDCIKELDGPGEPKKGLLDLVDEIAGVGPPPIVRNTTANNIKNIIKEGPNSLGALYRVRELDLLRESSTLLDITTRAMLFSRAVGDDKGKQRIKSRWELEYNPLKPDRTENPTVARTVDIYSFIGQQMHPENLLFPSARVLERVDGYSRVA